MAQRIICALALAARLVGADRIDQLMEEREKCETEENCQLDSYMQLLMDLGDAHLITEDEEQGTTIEMVDDAIEAYEAATQKGFDAMDDNHSDGPMKDFFLTALLRNADAYALKGEYKEAHQLYSGWLETAKLDDSIEDPTKRALLMRVLVKQGHVAGLGGQKQIAKDSLLRAVRLNEEISASASTSAPPTDRYAELRKEMQDAEGDVDDKSSLRMGVVQLARVHLTIAGEHLPILSPKAYLLPARICLSIACPKA